MSLAKSAALARTIVDSGAWSTDDVGEIVAPPGVRYENRNRGGILRATKAGRWAGATEKEWNDAVLIARAFLEDV